MLIADEDIDSMIARAVREERERCAKIAEDAINGMNGQRKAGMARAIARRIRAGDGQQTKTAPPKQGR